MNVSFEAITGFSVPVRKLPSEAEFRDYGTRVLLMQPAALDAAWASREACNPTTDWRTKLFWDSRMSSLDNNRKVI